MVDRPKDFDYQTYLASREWAVLREQIRQRSDNRCEHCFSSPQQAVHHLTYERIGQEQLSDLLAVCNPCHEFLSGKVIDNPISERFVVSPEINSAYFEKQGLPGFHFFIPREAGEVRNHLCRGGGCLWCGYADDNWYIFMDRLYKRPYA